jgi:serine/threonine protein phosphatase PrpC
VLKVRHWNYQGSTAVAVVIHHCPKESKTSIITANVGDSRAVLSRRGKAVDLTQVSVDLVDHTVRAPLVHFV